MTVTTILTEEHRVITKVLDCLDKIIEEAESDGKLNPDSAAMAIDFFTNLADGCQHAKEEDSLFVVMEQSGVPRQGGPIGVMLTEHDEGRAFVRGMARSVDDAANGDESAIRAFSENARDFIALLRGHIDKEDAVLFPMADNVLDHDIAGSLLTDFRLIEAEAGGQRHNDYLTIARQLCERYGLTFLDSADITTIETEFLSQ